MAKLRIAPTRPLNLKTEKKIFKSSGSHYSLHNAWQSKSQFPLQTEEGQIQLTLLVQLCDPVALLCLILAHV